MPPREASPGAARIGRAGPARRLGSGAHRSGGRHRRVAPPYHLAVTISIRPIADAELAAWISALQLPFFAEGDPERNAALRRPHIDLARCLGAFDGDRICGTFRSLATELTLPGDTTAPASAITAVTVLPTHRRQGLLRRMMAADLDATVERGEPIAILIASEYPIYGRYGFGRAADHVRLSVDARSARFVRPDRGTVELVERGVIRELGPTLYERFRLRQVGSITRSDFWWDSSLGIVESPWPLPKSPRQVLYRDERGQPQGYLRYHVDEHWNDRLSATTLVVDELLSATDDAYARLWRYACEVDWVVTVKAEDRSPDEVLPWLLEDARAVQQHHRSDFLWARILDPVAALGARRYAAPGRVVFDVRDEAGYAGGRFALEDDGAGAVCRRTTEDAEVALDVRALGSIHLGGTSLRTLASAGWADEIRAGAVERVDAMFRSSVAPWCSTWF